MLRLVAFFLLLLGPCRAQVFPQPEQVHLSLGGECLRKIVQFPAIGEYRAASVGPHIKAELIRNPSSGL